MLTLACPRCSWQYEMSPALAGKLFICPLCLAETLIPRLKDIHEPPPTIKEAFTVTVSCPGCSRVLNVEPDKASGWLVCPFCSLVFSARPTPSLPDKPPAEEEDESTEEASDDSRGRRAKKRGPRRRPILTRCYFCAVAIRRERDIYRRQYGSELGGLKLVDCCPECYHAYQASRPVRIPFILFFLSFAIFPVALVLMLFDFMGLIEIS